MRTNPPDEAQATELAMEVAELRKQNKALRNAVLLSTGRMKRILNGDYDDVTDRINQNEQLLKEIDNG